VRTIQQSLAAWGKDGTQTLVATINVDKFKRLNEQLGHHAGDQALVAITGSLQGLLRRATCWRAPATTSSCCCCPASATTAAARDRLRQLLQAVNRDYPAGRRHPAHLQHRLRDLPARRRQGRRAAEQRGPGHAARQGSAAARSSVSRTS
jgi:GGDEF domain-containing protein